MAAPKIDIYTKMTERLLELMDSNTVPWRKTWTDRGAPRNLHSGKAYRGSNVFWLSILSQYSSPYFLTFKQALDLGGCVKKGEKGFPVIFWKTGKKASEVEGEKDKTWLMARGYTVFNLEQTESVRVPKGRIELVQNEGGKLSDAANAAGVERADMIFDSYVARERIKFLHGGDRACYIPKVDSIKMPHSDSFDCSEEYHATRFHEAGHSTGTSLRLKRPGIENFDYFGSHQYSEEELVAEFTATFLCSVCEINREETIENSAAYLAHWRSEIRKDPKLVVMAAQRAQKAADFILGDFAEKPVDAQKATA